MAYFFVHEEEKAELCARSDNVFLYEPFDTIPPPKQQGQYTYYLYLPIQRTFEEEKADKLQCT